MSSSRPALEFRDANQIGRRYYPLTVIELLRHYANADDDMCLCRTDDGETFDCRARWLRGVL